MCVGDLEEGPWGKADAPGNPAGRTSGTLFSGGWGTSDLGGSKTVASAIGVSSLTTSPCLSFEHPSSTVIAMIRMIGFSHWFAGKSIDMSTCRQLMYSTRLVE